MATDKPPVSRGVIRPDVQREEPSPKPPDSPSTPSKGDPSKDDPPPPTSQGVEKPPNDNPGDTVPV
jgi:hypothetical protein